MTGSGNSRPSRPQLEMVAPNASPAEAAAIAAALERFLGDTTPAIAPQGAPIDPWARAAVLEGVGLPAQTPWGDGEPWR